MNEGISPITEIESKPVSIDAGDRIWKVTNYDHTYLGRVSLSRAIVSSDNSVYAQLTDLVGPKAIVKTAHGLGIRSRLDAVLLHRPRLGRREPARDGARVRDARQRRAARRRLGVREPPARRRVRRAHPLGRVEENAPIPTQVLDEGHAELLTGILEDVVQRGNRASAQPSPAARSPARPGTTDNYGDAWFVGYTPELVVAVWVGYPDALGPMLTEFGGEPVAGGTLPAHDLEGVRREGREGRRPLVRLAPVPRRLSTWVVDATASGSSTTATAAARG